MNKTIEQRVVELPGTLVNNPTIEDLGIVKFNGYNSRQILFRYDQGDNRRILLQNGEVVIEIDTGFVVDPEVILNTFQFL